MSGVLPQSLLSYRFFDLIGISRARLVSGPIQVTEYALLPREGGCQDAAYNAWELHAMRETLLKLAERHHSSPSYLQWKASLVRTEQDRLDPSHDCNILLLYRTMTKFSQNLFDKKRRFSQAILTQLVSLLQESSTAHSICSRFHGNHSYRLNVQIFSDADERLMECIPCQIRLFTQSHLVIGVRAQTTPPPCDNPSLPPFLLPRQVHGAGLMNTIFLSPQSIVIEIVPDDGMDSRHLPWNGIFPRLSAVFGLHHYLYLDNLTSPLFPERLLTNIARFIEKMA
jgi:hypothetical protein